MYSVGLGVSRTGFMVAGKREVEDGAEVMATGCPRWKGLPLEQSDMTINYKGP